MHELKLFTGTANINFAKEVAKCMGLSLSNACVNKFSDGEINVQISESVRGQNIYIIQPTCKPSNDHLMELLIMADAFKRSSASNINAVIPYFGYARQDRKAAPRVPISAKLVANLLQVSGINRVITMDLHAGQIQGFFDIPVDNLYGSIIFSNYVNSKKLKNPIIASPDIGGVARARQFANKLGMELVIVDKKRQKANESEVMNIIGDVCDRSVILIDDIIDTAGTICNAANALKNNGAISVIAIGTHAVFSKDAINKIENSAIDEIAVTDSIPLQSNSKKVKILSAAPLFAEAIHRIHNNESVDSLFN